ncbi:hypothetical protein BDF22DRAFT_662119 [Syncephalis plumigaleata]|nr:hypothetical protein BDF22DRAFT_662119 [Syncephalis plumigaleata]
MSRRLFQQATSGIVSLPTPDGERIIPASRRPDGSVRPARKVRAGYVPAEDQQRFQSRRVADRRLPGNFVVGRDDPSAISSPSSASSSPRPSNSSGSWFKQEAYNNNAATTKHNASRPVKSAWDNDSDEDTPTGSSNTSSTNRPLPLEDMTPAQRKNEKRRLKRQADAQAKVAADLQASVEEAIRERKVESSQKPALKEDTTATVATDPKKRIRALSKKIRQAKELQRRRDEEGATLLPQETHKVESIEELEAELEKLSLDE